MAAEDANGTLKTVLTRSTSRLQLLGAKALATATYVCCVVAPVRVERRHRQRRALLAVSAWGSLLSTITRNSAASVVGMLVFSFANQIIGLLPNVPTGLSRWLLTGQFTAWQEVLGTTIASGALWRAVAVSALYGLPPLLLSAWWFRRRDVLV